MNSYQKLKKKLEEKDDRYRELFRDFVKVIRDPDSYESLLIKSRIEMEASTAELWLFGQRNGYTMLGLLEKISEKSSDA